MLLNTCCAEVIRVQFPVIIAFITKSFSSILKALVDDVCLHASPFTVAGYLCRRWAAPCLVMNQAHACQCYWQTLTIFWKDSQRRNVRSAAGFNLFVNLFTILYLSLLLHHPTPPPPHTHTHTQYLGELKDIPTSVDMSKRGYLLSQLDTQRV